jgi:hypothetical protein
VGVVGGHARARDREPEAHVAREVGRQARRRPRGARAAAAGPRPTGSGAAIAAAPSSALRRRLGAAGEHQASLAQLDTAPRHAADATTA